MTDMPNTMGIIVGHRDKDGKPLHVYPYDGDTAGHVAGCANVARSILATEKAKQSLICLGDKFNRSTKDPWYGSRPMKVIVEAFLKHVMTGWPPIFLEDGMTNPDHTGGTFRLGWNPDFDTRQQTISLNARVGRH